MKLDKNIINFFKFTRYVIPYLPSVVLAFIAITIISFIGLVPPLIIKGIIDYSLPNRDVILLSILIIVDISIHFLLRWFNFLSTYLKYDTSEKISVELRDTFFSKVVNLPLTILKKYKTGDLIVRLQTDIDNIAVAITTTAPNIIATVLELIFILCITLYFDWRLTLFALTGIPIYIFETNYFAKKNMRITQEQREQTSKIFSLQEEKLNNIKTIKIYTQEDVERKKLYQKLLEMLFIDRRMIFLRSVNSFIDGLIIKIWFSLLLAYAGFHVITEVLSIGELMAMVMYFDRLYQPFIDMGDLYKDLVENSVSIGRINEVLAQELEESQKEGLIELAELKGRLEFRDVSFGFEPESPILKNLSFVVEPNTTTAIVGESGGGKSSVLNLLFRFYRPTSGKIFLDDIDYEKISVKSLRNHITMIAQNATLFDDTILNNIKYGNPDVSNDAIELSVREAHAHEFIHELKDGYNYITGPSGSNLSGGQCQRLVIARTLLRSPEVFLFDEATSALDTYSEFKIQETINNLMKKRTLIIVAHRLSTIKNAGQIIVLEKGSIVEKGRFTDLMEKRGVFFLYYQMQFAGFQNFLQQVSSELKRAKRYESCISIAKFEIDNFNKYTDEFGPEFIDTFIIDFELFLTKILREVDFATWHESGIFWLAFPEIDSKKVVSACHRIMSAVNDTTFNGKIRLTGSVGATSYPENNALDGYEMARIAEKALEVAKARGENQFELLLGETL